MKYLDFKNTYKKTLKKYNVDIIFDILNDKVITETRTHYIKSGSKWIKTDEKTEKINGLYYMNVLDSVQFFRNLGGLETVKKTYTKHGFIPTTINSVNPSRDEKTVRSYSF